MFIDELKIQASAGKGGDGVERWRHEKFKEFAGPSGGNGGKGGDVYARGVRDLNVLSKYRHVKKIKAENGEDGRKDSQHGKDGKDVFVDVPVGTLITFGDFKIRIEEEGQEEILLKGGEGGLGNEHFKSSRNTTPKETTPGKPGQSEMLNIEVELVADVGLIGFPSAGKSSLLNELTNANSKVGSYEFTTLDPHLGDMYGYVVGDMPGLIEGASSGKGLGLKFLRHVKRTKMLLHLISLEKEDVIETYEKIRKEVESYGNDLDKKEEVIVLTKTDLVSKEKVNEMITKFGSDKEVLAISVYDDESIKNLRDFLISKLKVII